MTDTAKLLLLAACVALAGCGPDPTMSQPETSSGAMTAESERFRIERIEVFRDGLAYDGTRGVYVIKDKRTGREFIGVSGIGISEVGHHAQSNGKTTYYVEDER